MQTFSQAALTGTQLASQAHDYLYDAAQRTVLFADIIRKRGNAYLDHIKAGQPPVLAFDYDTIMDGAALDRPVNYKLVRIFDRRHDNTSDKKGRKKERRELDYGERYNSHHPKKRPIVVMDPRAGHGPGIGGSKMDSQIGIALNAGHPVYFIMFLTHPMPGQTIYDVQQCQIRFLEEVGHRHPEAQKPAIIGNCQAGWAAALIGADRPDVTGPLVLNGSPLSYWGGVKGANPMRYRGGLFGGSWLSSFSADMGNGKFDGAHLVAGFEELNAANTFWTKQYNVYSRVDTEEKRFLDFERWWGGFFLLDREEIRFIVNNLFISDELEQGYLKLSKGTHINLKNFKDPILVFASKGDNITPPQQALNWITKVYKDVDEIKQHGQTIIYLLHDTVGHLGIFVSSKINRKEHKGIIGCVDALDFLSPGLYEMVIQEEATHPQLDDYQVEFVERDMADILAMDDGFEDEEAFHPVSSISKLNDRLYQDYLSPWVKLWMNDLSAEFIRQSHPLRVQRYGFSDLNPMMAPVGPAAEFVKQTRTPATETNVFSQMEKAVSGLITDSLELYQKTRDNLFETMFYTTYGNPWIKTLFYDDEREVTPESTVREPVQTDMFRDLEHQLWLKAMKQGGFEAAVIRMNLAVTGANLVIDMAEYDAARLGMKTDHRLKALTPEQLKQIVRDQAALLEKDRELALQTLADLLPDEKDRALAVDIARSIADIESARRYKKTAILKRIEDILLPDVDTFKYSS